MLEPIAWKAEEQCLIQALEEKEQATGEDMIVREDADSSTIKKKRRSRSGLN